MGQPELTNKIEELKTSLGQVIKGKPEVINTSIIALFSGSHVLIEDVPGVGKTTLANTLARSTNLSFKRIQFTSDLLPSDIVGVPVYDRLKGEFEFKPGPLFANIVLADEINRGTPKTQSALLEAMNEGRVTVDGHTYELPKPFMVIATQNPYEYKGTYPLPENQLDRFAVRISIGYPDRQSEKLIMSQYSSGNAWEGVSQVLTSEEILELQKLSGSVSVDDSLLDYILAIITQTRESREFDLGVSPRGAIALKTVSQAKALSEGRDYCIPDDIKQIGIPLLAHRVFLKNERFGVQGAAEEALNDILQNVKVPL